MSQYFTIVNLDKKEQLHTQRCGDGMKVGQILNQKGLTLKVLGYLLMKSRSNPFRSLDGDAPELNGHWAGDRIAIVGDSDHGSGAFFPNIFDIAEKEYRDISFDAMEEMMALQIIEGWHFFDEKDASSILWWNQQEPGFEAMRDAIENAFGKLEPRTFF